MVYKHAPKKVFVPGHYTSTRQRVWIPGTTKRIWVQPVYAKRYDACGKPVRVLVSAGHWETIRTPGCYQVKIVRVWKQGHWKYV